MFTVGEIVKAVGGELIKGDTAARIRGVSTDTRKVRRGELFIAIKGDNFDAHQFTAKAAASGATAVLVQHRDVDCPDPAALILVRDTVKALGALARHHRLKFRIPVVAITGSAGKTTTKEFMAAVLQKKFKVLFNHGTENNHIGVPMTLLQLRPDHQAAVIEAGTNHHGEIDWLGWIACPTIAVYTNIGQSHLAGLGTPEGVLKEKAALIRHLSADGVIVLNNDDPLLRKLIRRGGGRRVLTYGVDRAADLRATGLRSCRGGLAISLDRGRSFRLSTPVWGNIYNALAVVSCGQFLKVPFRDMALALGRVRPAPGRQCFHRVNGVLVIDDTYNANPVSYKNAIRTLALVRGKGRTFLVAADMLELGERAEALHREVGEVAGRAGVDQVLTMGRWARLIGDGAAAVRPEVITKDYVKQEAIALDLLKGLQAGDVVLVKGSRGMRMELVVESLLSKDGKG